MRNSKPLELDKYKIHYFIAVYQFTVLHQRIARKIQNYNGTSQSQK